MLPGETALAFYKAKNMSKEDIIGVATYSVTPGQVAPYFSKIQCFCFEGLCYWFLLSFFIERVLITGSGWIEQKLNAGEEVDMPVFFFIDPDFLEDPQMKGIETVTLSYTFFSKLFSILPNNLADVLINKQKLNMTTTEHYGRHLDSFCILFGIVEIDCIVGFVLLIRSSNSSLFL